MIDAVPSTEISAFSEYYSAAWGPEMARDRVGATEDEMELFQKLAGTPIPNSYRGYLREFGRHDGA